MSNDFQPTSSRLPVCLRSADDTAETATAGAKDTRPVFADPSGRRRILVRGTATTLAAAGVAFMAGAGLLLSNQPLPAAPYSIGGLNAAGGQGGRAAADLPAAIAVVPLPGDVFVPVRQGSEEDTDASGSSPSSPSTASQPVEQPGVGQGGGSAAAENPLPGAGSPADATPPPAEVVPPADDSPAVVPPAEDPPPAQEPGLLSPVIDPLTAVVGALLGPLL